MSTLQHSIYVYVDHSPVDKPLATHEEVKEDKGDILYNIIARLKNKHKNVT